jgi:hypothetical protein
MKCGRHAAIDELETIRCAYRFARPASGPDNRTSLMPVSMTTTSQRLNEFTAIRNWFSVSGDRSLDLHLRAHLRTVHPRHVGTTVPLRGDSGPVPTTLVAATLNSYP